MLIHKERLMKVLKPDGGLNKRFEQSGAVVKTPHVKSIFLLLY